MSNQDNKGTVSGDPGGVDPGMPVAGSDANSVSADKSGGSSRGAVDQIVAKAGEMKDKASSLQGEITGIEKEGEAAGGLVKAIVDGGGNLKSIKIDPSLMDGEPAVLEELILNAVASSKQRVQDEAGEKVKEMLGGLPIPSSITNLIAQYMPGR